MNNIRMAVVMSKKESVMKEEEPHGLCHVSEVLDYIINLNHIRDGK